MIKNIFKKHKWHSRYRNNILNSFFDKSSYLKTKRWFRVNLNLFSLRGYIKNNNIINIISWAIILIILLLVLWPFLRVNKIEITKKDYITNINIAYKSIDYLRWKSIFLINFENIKNKLKKYQVNIKEVNVKLSLPESVKIEIWSYPWVFNTDIKNKNYIITENGVFIPMKKYSELRDIKIYYNKLNDIQIFDYKKILNEKYIIKINNLVNKLEENILSIKINSIYYFTNEREVHFVTKSWIRLIYDLDSSIDSQVKKTVILDKQNYEINKWNLVYIDFRIKDKIYYCDYKNKLICLKHIKRIYGK